MALPLAFPKLPATQDDSQHSRLIRLLVALLEAVGFRPTSTDFEPIAGLGDLELA